MGATATLNVSYAQFAVFASSLRHPFNDWTDRHVMQGFAWRPGSVSFRSMVDTGPHEIEINVVNHMEALHPDAVRAVEVPFEVPADGKIEVGSITETVDVSVPPGIFLLRCEFLSTSNTGVERVRLTFADGDAPRFAVVRADPELSLGGPLLTTAQPA